MRRTSLKRQRTNRQRKQLRDALLAEGAPCEARLAGCTNRGTDWHEVKTRARGGSIVETANRGWLCRKCHMEITRNSGKDGWAIRHGWVVASWASDEAQVLAAHLRTVFRCGIECLEDHRG